MPCREGWGGTEGAGRGSAQRTLGQWWPVCGAGAENKNWGLPVGALVVVGKDGGGDLNQQQGELREGTALTQGGGPVGLLAHGRFWGCRVSLASAAVFGSLLCWWEILPLAFLPILTLLLCSVPILITHLGTWHLHTHTPTILQKDPIQWESR